MDVRPIAAMASPLMLCESIDELLRCANLAPLAAADSPKDWATIRAELAGRNLGLVRVADTRSFSWPGCWLAIVEEGGEFQAGVMYGSPSAPVWPEGFTGKVQEGYVLAPFDPGLDAHLPYPSGADQARGTVVGVFVTSRASAQMRALEKVRARAGAGLEGDRYATGRGTFSGRTGYQVTLFDARHLGVVDPPLTPDETRRNIITSGVDLNSLVGQRFTVGTAGLIGRRLCEPCRHLQELVGRPVIRPLIHKGGLRADILLDGVIELGSDILTSSRKDAL
jgi:MOSC domain-containing protein YiiM